MGMKPLAPKPMGPRKKATPVPLPKRSIGGTAKKIAPGPKLKNPNMKTPKPKKKPTLDDFLLKGKRPPLAPGQKKLPSDADVILKGYNDKKTINRYKKGK